MGKGGRIGLTGRGGTRPRSPEALAHPPGPHTGPARPSYRIRLSWTLSTLASLSRPATRSFPHPHLDWGSSELLRDRADDGVPILAVGFLRAALRRRFR